MKCSMCKRDKGKKEFHKNKNKPSGFHSLCKECHKVVRRKSYIKNKEIISVRQSQKRKEILDYINVNYKNRPCTDCKNTYHPECLDFDHLETGNKINCISRLVRGYTLKMIEKEILKCELVCANCHRLRTYHRRLQTINK